MKFIDKQKYIEVQGLSIKNNEMCTYVCTIVFANFYVSLLQVQSICHARFFKFNTNNKFNKFEFDGKLLTNCVNIPIFKICTLVKKEGCFKTWNQFFILIKIGTPNPYPLIFLS